MFIELSYTERFKYNLGVPYQAHCASPDDEKYHLADKGRSAFCLKETAAKRIISSPRNSTHSRDEVIVCYAS